MTENTKKVSRGAGRVAFLAHRDVIKRMLDQGYTRQAIYDDHKAALGFGYKYFAKCVNKYIKPESLVPIPPAPQPETPLVSPTQPEDPAPAKEPARPGFTRPKKFTFDPEAGNKRKDLF